MVSLTGSSRVRRLGLLVAGLVFVMAIIVVLILLRVFPAYPIGIEREIPVVSFSEAQRQASFTIPQPAWLPSGLVLKGAHVDPPNWAQIFYRRPEGGDAGLGIEIMQGTREGHYDYPASAKRPVTVARQPGICVIGAWNEQGQWSNAADVAALEWSAGAFNYHISASGLNLGCGDLIRIAESLR